MHNSHVNRWEYYILEEIMDTYARISLLWIIILTWLTKYRVNQKKQILRVETELLIIFFNTKFMFLHSKMYANGITVIRISDRNLKFIYIHQCFPGDTSQVDHMHSSQ